MQKYNPAPTTRIATTKPSSTGLPVVCFSTYVAEPGQRVERHRDAQNFLLALRGDPVNGVSAVPVGEDEKTLTATNANDSIDWFGEMVVQYLDQYHIRPPFGLVPVPTPKMTLGPSAGPWTSLLAISIASNGLEEVSVLDLLRWQKPLVSSEQRGRTVSELYENLAVIGPFPTEDPIVLVDYLFTGSSTLQACAARLRRHGANVVLGLCAGRTAKMASHDPFAIVTGEVEHYRPGH